jgi:septal ring factor EnvC (AmiA/AmiB activator)
VSEVKCSTCKGTKTITFERGQRCVPCVTCSGSGINWRKTCESVRSELAALRDRNAQLCEWQSKQADQVAALREELAEVKSQSAEYGRAFNAQCRKTDSLSKSLTAAEQRNEDQLKIIAGLVEYANNLLANVNNAWSYAGSTGNPETHKDDDYAAAVALIAKPTKSGASE